MRMNTKKARIETVVQDHGRVSFEMVIDPTVASSPENAATRKNKKKNKRTTNTIRQMIKMMIMRAKKIMMSLVMTKWSTRTIKATTKKTKN